MIKETYNNLLKEDNGAAVEVMRDKYLPLFNKHGIKLKDYKIGSSRGNKTLILYPETSKDFKAIYTSLEKTFGSSGGYYFKKQKPFKAAGKQYKVTYDNNVYTSGPDKDNGWISIMPVEVGYLSENNLLKEEDAEQLMNWLGLKDVKLRKNNSPNGSHVTVTTTSVPEYVETQLQNNQDWKNYYSKHQVIDAGGAFGDAQSIIVFHREDQPELEDEPWTDPAGGTHYGGEDDPAAAYLEENLNEGIGPLAGVMLLGLTAAVLGGVAANVGGSLDSLTKYIYTGGPGKAAENLKQASKSSWGSFLRKLPFIGSKLKKQDEENRLKAEIGAALQEFIRTGEGVAFIKSLMEDPEGKAILTRISNGSSNYARLYDIIRKYLNIMRDGQGSLTLGGNQEWQKVKEKFFALRKDIKGGEYKDTITPPDKDDLNENKMKKTELRKIIQEAYLEHLREEDDEDIEDEMEDEFEAEPAVAQDGESKNQESAPRKRINFENRELEMLVDVNKNATKKGIKIQFLSDDELSKEERTKLVSSLQTYLDEGLAKFVKGAKLNIDSDQDVPNKTKTVGFTIKIGDVFGLVSKVFANRGDDEEDGEEVEAEETETEETEELQELRKQIRGFLKEEQMEMSFKTFEDVKNDMSEFPGFQEIAGGFSLPIEGIMGDALGGSYEFTENPDQTIKVTKVDGEGNELSSKSHPIDIIVGFLEKY